jgi:hypothetical protein
MSRSLSRPAVGTLSVGVLVPVVVGAFALALAVVLGYVTVRDTTGAEPASAAAAGTTKLPTGRLVSETGGFAVAVPTDLEASRQAGAVRLVSESKDLVILVGRAGRGPIGQAQQRMLTRLKREYPKMALLGVQSAQVNGNPTQTVYGQAVNDAGTRLRLAVVTVHAGSRNFSVVSYAAYDADPTTVLPRVNTVVNSFEVLDIAP